MNKKEIEEHYDIKLPIGIDFESYVDSKDIVGVFTEVGKSNEDIHDFANYLKKRYNY